MNQLGTFLRLRPDLVRSHLVSAWRLSGSGDLLGYTLVHAGKAILVAVVNEKNSGANLSPLPESPPPWSLADVQSWSLSEAVEKIDRGEVTGHALNGLLEEAGLSRRTTWQTYDHELDLDTEAEATGIYVATGNVRGVIPVDLVLTGARKILLDRGEIVGNGDKLKPSPVRVDGVEFTALERMKLTVGKVSDGDIENALNSQNRTQLDTADQSD